MWKDRAIVEVTAAVMHSFREAGMGEWAAARMQWHEQQIGQGFSA
jgi:nitric oxide synthase oxygenase domain/subunit